MIPKFTIAGIASQLSQKKPRSLLLLGIIFGLFPALFSIGFHHPDEQFSILELMNYKLGNVSADIFNWDFHLKIRPFFQVAIYTSIYKFFGVLGLENPFHFSALIRFFNYALGVFSFYCLIFSPLITLSQDQRKKLLLIVLSLWFVPYIMVRTSSESLSISLFLLGLSFYTLEKKSGNFFIMGLLMGLSFATRFQMGISAFSFFLWLIFIKGKSFWRASTFMCVGVVLGAASLMLFDYWGYGDLVFSPWNYLRENLINQKVNSFGVKPFYYFFTKGLVKGGVFPALLCLMGAIVFLRKNIRSPWPWIMLPYLVVHSLIGHKEVRFLNFLYVLTPILAYMSWDHFKFKGRGILLKLAIGINIILLFRVFFFPVYKPLVIYRYIFDNIPSTEKIYTPTSSSKAPLTLQMRFYTKSERKLIGKSFDELGQYDNPFHLLTSRFDERRFAYNLGCHELESLYPKWVYEFNYFNWLKRSAIWTLWSCQKSTN